MIEIKKGGIVMSLYENLVQRFGYDVPILTTEINYKSYSRPWIYKEMNRLCESGSVVHYDKGVYYIPTQTSLGQSLLNPLKVIEKKYLADNGEVFGYFSGISLLNRMGISTQVPSVLEIYTNKETSQVREVKVGRQKVVLRKARTKITSDNVMILSFLEMMNAVTPSYFNEERKRVVRDYIKQNRINGKDITKYAPYFPDKVMRNLIESEIIYDVTR